MGEQQSYYRENEEYADFLEGWDPRFYAKYADTLCPDEPGGKALDGGCGVGQGVQRLIDAGHEAHGVEVSGRASKRPGASVTAASFTTAAHCRLATRASTASVR